MLEGKVSAALKFLCENDSGVFTATNDVIKELEEKHPSPGPIQQHTLLHEPINEFKMYTLTISMKN